MIKSFDKYEFFGQIIDIFEDFLYEKGITLDNPERQETIDEGSAAEDLAVIFGSDYDYLRDKLEILANNWELIEQDPEIDLIPSFQLGKSVFTKRIVDRMDSDDKFALFVMESFKKYIQKDWGDLCDEDKLLNDYSSLYNDRIVGTYTSEDGTKLWIITECDRSVTTFLFPDEY